MSKDKAIVENLKTTADPKSSYYDAGGIETIEIMKAKLTPDQYKGFLLGNIIKYSTRANFKESFFRDVEKVGVYTKLLSECQNETEQGIDICSPIDDTPIKVGDYVTVVKGKYVRGIGWEDNMDYLEEGSHKVTEADGTDSMAVDGWWVYISECTKVPHE
jgi:hypothetical protein